MDYIWPSTLIPNASALEWIDNTARFVSPFSGATRTVNRPGGRWRLSMSFRARKPETAQQLEAFLWRLDGGTHRAIIPDYAYRRQGTGSGTPVVEGGSQSGRTLLTAGWSGAATMKAGDRFTLNGQMHVVAQDATASGGGFLLDEEGNQLLTEAEEPILIEEGGMQLFLAHAMRVSPTNGAALNITTPTAKYMLADRFDVAAEPGVFKALTVEFEEVIE
jgi:hypothetical protein